MKKVFLLLLTFGLIVGNASAQIESGKISVGGVLNISSNSTKYKDGSQSVDGPETSGFTFGPQVGYFFSEKLSFGAGLTFRRVVSSYNTFGNPADDIRTTFNINPFGRYHIKINDNFYMFGEAKLSLGLGSTKRKIDSDTNDLADLSTVGIAVSPGVIFFPSNRVGIELSFNLVSFERVADKDVENKDNKEIRSDFNFGPNLFTPNLGVQFYF